MNVSNGNMLAMSIGCSGAGAVIAPGIAVTGGGQSSSVATGLGESGAAGGAGAASAGAGASGANNQSQYLLTKLMQPTLSEDELNEIGRERANR